MIGRTVDNSDIVKYSDMVNMYIRNYFIKTWKEASFIDSDKTTFLGNTGMSVEDIRQQLTMEVVIGLQRYDPEYRTKAGKPVKESTFIYRHLNFRAGTLVKRLSRLSQGYGIWSSPIEDYLDKEV